MIEKLTTKLKSILEANGLLQKVYSFEEQQSDGFPYATLTMSANDAEFDTTTENIRTYEFLIRLYVERSNTMTPEDAESSMRELADSALNDFDKNWALSGLENQTGYTFLFMRAAPSAWGYIDEPAQMRVSEIKVRCVFEVDTSQIT